VSLRLRLALWYGCFTGLVVLLVSLLTYATHSRAHYDDMDHTLASAVAHVADESAAARTQHELETVLAAPIAPDLSIAVYGWDGGALYSTPNSGQYPSLDPRLILAKPAGPAFDAFVRIAPPFIAVEGGRGAFGLITDANGVRWRAYALPDDERGRFIVATSSLERIDGSVDRLLRLSLLLTALGAAFTFVGGRLLAGRALRPVAMVTRTAAAVAHSRDFRGRVPPVSGHDELGGLAATFNEMLGSLEQAYRAQQRFVSDASHELRAPLTAIQANLELLEHQSHMSPSDHRQAVIEASRETRRLVGLVADLLALARADAGVPLRRERVELDRVALSALGDARHLARGQKLEVTSLEPVLVRGDPDRLKQVCLILLDNALKYTPLTGTITLAVRRRGKTAEVAVDDTGVGISPEDLPHVFDRFYRADPARTRDPGGTGLGLPIGRWIAEQHGGSLILSSQLGRGTQARLSLPALP
jgi:signal transduction histidine kinase